MLVAFVVAWYLSGFLSCVWFVTQNRDFDSGDLLVSGLLMAWLGPIMTLIFFIMSDKSDFVVIKREK